MQEYIRDVIAWGRVVVQGKEFFLLAPKPYHSEMGNGVGHSVWQPEGTLKWEVADSDSYVILPLSENGKNQLVEVYYRSLIIFGSDALIEFFQDPKTIKVSYIVPQDDDDDNVAVAPTN